MYAFRDEPRARTGRDRSHTLVTVYQFANTPLSEETILEKLNDAMVPIGGETLASPEYEALGFKAESSEMLDNRHEDGYFPHFSQVRSVTRRRRAFSEDELARCGGGGSLKQW